MSFGFEPLLAKRWQIATLISAFGAAFPPILSFVLLWPLLGDLPTWDQWHLIELWDAHYSGEPVLPLLLESYNGHYNVIPRFVFYGLGLLTGWNLHAEVVLSYLLAFGTLLVMLRVLRDTDSRLLVLAAPISAQTFSLIQFENFMSGYPMGQNLAHFAAALAIWQLSRRGRSALAFAVVAAGIATFSHGITTGVWPAGFLMLVLLRPGKGGLFPPALWAALSLGVALMLRSLASSTGVSPDPLQVVPFALATLGTPLVPSASTSPTTAMVLGGIVGVAFLVAGARLLIAGRPEPSALAWVGFGTMAMTSAVLVALGRSFAGLQQSMASHYVTATYPLVVATLVLASLLWLRGKRSAASKVDLLALLPLIAIVMLQAAVASVSYYRGVRPSQRLVAAHNVALVQDRATDAQIRQTHHPDPQLVRWGVGRLRELQLAAFAGLPADARPFGVVDSFADVVPGSGGLRLPAGRQWRIEGWAAASRAEGGEVDEVVLEVDGVRVASAEVGLPRRDVAEYFSSRSFLETGWRLDFVAAALLAPGEYDVRILVSAGASYPTVLLSEDVTIEAEAASSSREFGRSSGVTVQ